MLQTRLVMHAVRRAFGKAIFNAAVNYSKLAIFHVTYDSLSCDPEAPLDPIDTRLRLILEKHSLPEVKV